MGGVLLVMVITVPVDGIVLETNGVPSHDDIIKWKHFRVTGPLCGNSSVAGDAELWCFFICAWKKNRWVNNREAGDSRRHRAYYNVIVMITGVMSVAVFSCKCQNVCCWCLPHCDGIQQHQISIEHFCTFCTIPFFIHVSKRAERD